MSKREREEEESSPKKLKEIVDLVSINFGGTVITMDKRILLAPVCDDKMHYFTTLLSGTFQNERDKDGNIYVECNPECAKIIMEFVRSSCNVKFMPWFDKTSTEHDQLAETCKLFGYAKLATLIQDMMIWAPDDKLNWFLFGSTETNYTYEHPQMPFEKGTIEDLVEKVDGIIKYFKSYDLLPDSGKMPTKLKVSDLLLTNKETETTVTSYKLKKTAGTVKKPEIMRLYPTGRKLEAGSTLKFQVQSGLYSTVKKSKNPKISNVIAFGIGKPRPNNIFSYLTEFTPRSNGDVGFEELYNAKECKCVCFSWNRNNLGDSATGHINGDEKWDQELPFTPGKTPFIVHLTLHSNKISATIEADDVWVVIPDLMTGDLDLENTPYRWEIHSRGHFEIEILNK